MGRDGRDLNRERPRNGQRDSGSGNGRTQSQGGPRRGDSPRADMTPPQRPVGSSNGRSGERGTTPSDPSGRRPANGRGGLAGGGGFIRPPIAGDPAQDDAYEDSAYRSGPSSRAGATRGPRSDPNSRRPPRDDDYPDRSSRAPASPDEYSGPSRVRGGAPPEASDTPGRGPRGGGRRSMAEMARDVSRSMSRQLSSVMSRTGRAVRGDATGYTPSSRAGRPSLPPAVAAQLAESAPYHRSRARMLARKWRLGRVQRNPIVYAIVVMVFSLLALIVAGGSAFGGAYAFNYYQSHRAQIQAIYNLRSKASSVILDRNGKTLATIKDDTGFNIYVNLEDISPKLQWATIDTEDRTFYSNVGVDFVGSVRSALTDLQHHGAAVQGGSTITQQLVKIIVAKDSTKTLVRKLNEAILAYGVTQNFTKAQILEMYLNTIPYGDSNAGIEAAARNYFRLQPVTDPKTGKTVTANMQLDWAQAALLAGVPNAPTTYLPTQYSCDKAPCAQSQWDNPFVDKVPCGQLIPSFYAPGNEWYLTHGHEWLVYCRASTVLDNILHWGISGSSVTFSQADDTAAKQELLTMLTKQQIYSWQNAPAASTSDTGSTAATVLAPHFVAYVQGILADWGYTDLGNAGIRVYTTLDYNLQHFTEQDLNLYINKDHPNPWYGDTAPLSTASNAHNGAAVAIDQHTGDIMMMVGSVDFNSKDPTVAGQNNVTILGRSMGSATKPIVYATDLQMGWTPGIMVQDQPICFPDPIPPDPTTGQPVVDPSAPACKGYYVPHNYDQLSFSGRFPLRYVFDNSLNIAATEGLAFAGLSGDQANNFLSMAQRLGITSLKKSDLGPSTALGTQDIPLIELTGAYAVFANGGKRVPPRAVLRIEDAFGNQIYPVPPGPTIAPPQAGQQVLSPETAYMLTSILTDNVARAPDFGYGNNPLHFTPPTVDGTNYPDFEMAAKTGTSSGPTGPRDIVTVGYTNYLTVGVWIGNSNSADMQSDIIGIAGAGYVFHDVMKWGIDNYHWPTYSHFKVPSDMAMGIFNCTTGLAPYKDTKIGDMKDPNYNCPFAPWDPTPHHNKNLYNYGEGRDHRVNQDWYIQGQAPLES